MSKKFSLMELIIILAIIAVLLSIIIPSINNAYKKAKKLDCMSNLREISMGYNLYRKDYMKYPLNTWFLDDFSPVYTYIKNTGVFNCKGENDIVVDDVSQLNAQTPYLRHMDLTDMEDWELSTSTSNGGGGNNPYGLDPSNPNFPSWIAGKLKIEGLHDKDISYHGSYNFIIMDKGSYMPIYSTELLWEMKDNRTLQKN